MARFGAFMLFFVGGVLSQAFAQHISAKGELVTCYESGLTERTTVWKNYRHVNHETTRIEASSVFQFDLVDAPGALTTIMLTAGEIWSDYIKTDYPIKVRVVWADLGTGTLGSASPASREANFDGAPVRNVWYPIALAEKLAQQEINEDDEYEIRINFNQGTPWYYGVDGNPLEGTYDLLSVALHEIGHGLGLSDTYDVDGGVGKWGWNGRPNIYDLYINNDQLEPLVYSETYLNNTTDLGIQLTSNAVRFKSEFAKQNSEEESYPRIYAPSEFDGGSSISHLDEDTYVAGDTNSLMTPQISREEVVHDPGPIIRGILADMGYVYAFINPDSVPDQTDFLIDLEITGKVKSDSMLIADGGKLIYSFDEFESIQTATLVFDEVQENFTATMEAPGFRTIVKYYFEVTDNLGRTYRSPATDTEDNYEFGYGIITSLGSAIEENVFAFYPNPASSQITLVNSGVYPATTFTLFDQLGNQVLKLDIHKNEPIDISALKTGFYIIQITSKNKSYSDRLVIRR